MVTKEIEAKIEEKVQFQPAEQEDLKLVTVRTTAIKTHRKVFTRWGD